MNIYKVYNRLFNTSDCDKIWRWFQQHGWAMDNYDLDTLKIRLEIEHYDVDTTQPLFYQLVQVEASVTAVPNGICVELGNHMWVFNQETNCLSEGRTVKFDEHLELPVIKL